MLKNIFSFFFFKNKANFFFFSEQTFNFITWYENFFCYDILL